MTFLTPSADADVSMTMCHVYQKEEPGSYIKMTSPKTTIKCRCNVAKLFVEEHVTA